MKKPVLTIVALLLVGLGAVHAVWGAPWKQAASAQRAVAEPDLPHAPETLYTTKSISPNVNLPDGSATFTCFDMALNVAEDATVVDVGVTVGHTHTRAGDLIYQLRNPEGEHVTMLHRPGTSGMGSGDSSNLVAGAPVTFSNEAVDNAETMGNALGPDGVICQDDGRCNYFPSPGEDATSLHSFANMVGSAADGTWRFCASDNEAGESGALVQVELTVVYDVPEVGACDIGAWQPIADVNTARSRTSLVYAETTGTFYLLGGEATGGDRDLAIEAYDAIGNTWTEKSHLLTGVSNTSAAVVGPYIYMPGGFDGAASVPVMQRYDPAADEVTAMAAMPAGNQMHATTALAGKVYVLGGSESGMAGITHYIYDVATDTWSSGAPLPAAVNFAAATTDGTYIYVLGGNTTDLKTVQRYDPATNSWDPIEEMKLGRGGAAAFFDGANVWVVGGGWTDALAATEYWDGAQWQTGPATGSMARTLGAAFGGGMAVKAAGWNGAYVATAEAAPIDCSTPDIEASTDEISATQTPGQMVTHTVTIGNSGGEELTWSATKAPPLRPLAFSAEPAGEGLTYYAERSAFDEAHPGLPLEDFEEGNVVPGGVRTCPAPVDENSENVCFGPGDIVAGILFQNEVVSSANGLALAGAGLMDNPTISLFTTYEEEQLEIFFTAPDVYAVGLDLYSQYAAGAVDITIYGWNGSTALGTTTAAGTPAGIFWGVASEQPIGRITMRSASGQFEGVDNVAFGNSSVCTTPEALPWVTVSPDSGTVAAGGSQVVNVAFDSTGMEAGEKATGTLCLISNDPDEPQVEVALSLTVAAERVYLPVILKR